MQNSINNHPQIELLCNGDSQTLKALYRDFFPKFRGFVLKNSGSSEDAEEVFQNALFQLIARAKTSGVQINSSFESYLFVVCKNLWFKEINSRKKQVRNDGVIELKSEDQNDLEGILYQKRWDLFDEMLQKLSSNCQELLKAYFNKTAYSVIVETFGYANENTAFQRMFKCKKRLAELVKNDVRFKNLF